MFTIGTIRRVGCQVFVCLDVFVYYCCLFVVGIVRLVRLVILVAMVTASFASFVGFSDVLREPGVVDFCDRCSCCLCNVSCYCWNFLGVDLDVF